MAEDDVGVVVFDAAEGDKADADFLGVRAGHQIFLGVDVNIGRRILEQDFFLDPLVHFFAGAGVDVVLRRIAGQHAAFFDGDQVVGALGVVAFLHRGANLVVGLGEHVIERYAVGVVAEGAKRLDFCHGASCGRN